MTSQVEPELFSLTFATLAEKPFAEIVSVPLMELRKVLQDGPEPFSQRADSDNMNEVLAAVLKLNQSIQTPTDLREEDKANSNKFFDMSSEDLIRMANSARPNLVRLMQSALRYDADIKPRDFDPSNSSSVITVALTWKLDSTSRALQNSLSGFQHRDTNSNRDTTANDDGPQPDVPQNNSQPENDISLLANPFANNTTGPSGIHPLAVSNVFQQSNGQKRPYQGITLTPQPDPKRVRFCNLSDINSAQPGTVSNFANQDFRGGGARRNICRLISWENTSAARIPDKCCECSNTKRQKYSQASYKRE